MFRLLLLSICVWSASSYESVCNRPHKELTSKLVPRRFYNYTVSHCERETEVKHRRVISSLKDSGWYCGLDGDRWFTETFARTALNLHCTERIAEFNTLCFGHDLCYDEARATKNLTIYGCDENFCDGLGHVVGPYDWKRALWHRGCKLAALEFCSAVKGRSIFEFKSLSATDRWLLMKYMTKNYGPMSEQEAEQRIEVAFRYIFDNRNTDHLQPLFERLNGLEGESGFHTLNILLQSIEQDEHYLIFRRKFH